MNPSNPPARALPIALVVASALFMEMLDSTIILTALPKMAESFGVTPVELSAGITAYLLAVALLLPASGWVADRFGTRRVFMIAIAVFVLSSMWCGLCDTRAQFIAARLVQGAAAAMMSPVGRLAMLRVIDRQYMARAVNLGAMAALLGPMLGPPIGGLMSDYLSWRWIFFVNLPIGIIGLYGVWRLIPEFRAEQLRSFDTVGFLLNGGALLGVLYGLQLLSESGQGWQAGLPLAALGVVLGVLALRHARRVEHPLVSLGAMQLGTFAATFNGGLIFRLAMFAPHFALPLLLQLGLGMSATIASLYILFHAGADVFAKLFVIRHLRHYGHRVIMIWSAVIFAAFNLSLLLVSAHTPTLVLGAMLMVGGVARSYHMTASNTLMMGVLPPEHLTGGSTLSALMQQCSQALAIALAAGMLQVAVVARGGDASALLLQDFWPVLVVSALLAVLSIACYRPLSGAAGAEISGYKGA